MKPRFRDLRDRLRFVGTKRRDYDLGKFPDFLIIGPQRAGTTWLHESLSRHPQVFIPLDKELHYFNNLEHPEYHPKSLPPVDRDLGWYLDRFRIPTDFAGHRERQCRADFGRGFAPKVFGEATATYAAALHEGIIAEIVTLNPDIKIITMIRDPIERAWSHAKKDLCLDQKRAVADVPDAEWLEFFAQPYQVACGNYSTFLPRWQKIVPARNLLIGRFLDIAADPVGLLLAAFRLIGIDASEKLIPGIARERVNPTEAAAIPPHLRARLESLFGDEVARLRGAGMI